MTYPEIWEPEDFCVTQLSCVLDGMLEQGWQLSFFFSCRLACCSRPADVLTPLSVTRVCDTT